MTRVPPDSYHPATLLDAADPAGFSLFGDYVGPVALLVLVHVS